MTTAVRRLVPLVIVLLVVAGCAASGTAASAPPSPAPAPSAEPVTSAEDAFDRIVALEPRLAGIQPLDPEMIGGSSWYEATEADGGYAIDVYVGWGDCQSGCIDHHTWTYLVATDGRVALVAEDGSDVPAAEWPSPGGTGRTGILGTALAGPACPVEQPDDPDCLPRPVVQAPLVITDANGEEIARVLTDELGSFFVELPAGTYRIVARPVEGLMGFPEPIEIEVTEGEATVELQYDTGIR
jgi:hypothetical protein